MLALEQSEKDSSKLVSQRTAALRTEIMVVEVSTVELNPTLAENNKVIPGNSGSQSWDEWPDDKKAQSGQVENLDASPVAGSDSNLRVLQQKSCKRENTRAALVAATKALVLERGKEKISIQEITNRASVGSGTFYNYFESKHRVFEAIAEEMLAEFEIELNELRASLKDPAMIVAVTLNHCFRRSHNHKTWNKFLSAVNLNEKYVLIQDANQCYEDIERGVSAGRFKVENIPFTQNLILAMVRHINREIRLGKLPLDAIEDATRAILKMLGISDVIARALTQPARRPVAAARHKPMENSGDAEAELSRGLLHPISGKSRIIG